MSADRKEFGGVSARAGQARAVRVAYGSDIEAFDGVELTAFPRWLKHPREIVAKLTPRQARTLALQLLKSAEVIDDRRAAE